MKGLITTIFIGTGIFATFAYYDHVWVNQLYRDCIYLVKIEYPDISNKWIKREIKDKMIGKTWFY